MSEPAGWYANPDGTDSERFWDGSRWTHDVRPVPGKAAPPPMHNEVASAPNVVGSLLRSEGGGPDPVPTPPGVPGATVPGLSGEAVIGRSRGAANGLPAGAALRGDVSPDPVIEPDSGGPSPGGPLTDLFRLLFDFSFGRALTPELAAILYRLGAIGTLVVIALLLALGLLAGGAGAIISLVLWPIVGLLSLVHLRAALQAAVGVLVAAPATGPESVEGVEEGAPPIPAPTDLRPATHSGSEIGGHPGGDAGEPSAGARWA